MVALREALDPDLVIFGGPDEGERAARLAGAIPFPVAVLAGASALSLQHLAALAARLDLLVSNDTGPMHIAAAMGVPVVALFGSTLPGLTGPVGEGHRCLQVDLPCAGCYRALCPFHLECLHGLSVEQVLEGVIKTLTR